MHVEFTENDYRLTQLDYMEAISKIRWDFEMRSFLKGIRIDEVAGLDRWTVSGGGEYTGAWAKRWSKYTKKKTGVNLNPSDISIVTEYLNRTIRGIEHSIDFDVTDHANWEPGEFGDNVNGNRSCWWGEQNSSRLGLVRMGGGAIRFYGQDGKGRARLWYYPIDEGRNAVLFNVKDREGKMTLLSVARILSMKFGIKYTRSYNTHVPASYLDGETVFIAGLNPVDRLITLRFAIPPVKIRDMSGYSAYDNVAAISTANPGTIRCTHCDMYFDTDDITRVGDDYACEECLDTHYFLCNDCNEWDDKDNSTYIEDGDYLVCDNCCGEYSYCDGCGKWNQNEHITEVNDGRLVCMDCLDNYTQCSDCGDWFQELADVEGDTVCNNCLDNNDKYTDCGKCGDWIYTDTATDVVVDNDTEAWCRYCTKNKTYVCETCDMHVADQIYHGHEEEVVADEN